MFSSPEHRLRARKLARLADGANGAPNAHSCRRIAQLRYSARPYRAGATPARARRLADDAAGNRGGVVGLNWDGVPVLDATARSCAVGIDELTLGVYALRLTGDAGTARP
jgi:hypothetical protein